MDPLLAESPGPARPEALPADLEPMDMGSYREEMPLPEAHLDTGVSMGVAHLQNISMAITYL